jgi:hypothetical protein
MFLAGFQDIGAHFPPSTPNEQHCRQSRGSWEKSYTSLSLSL